MIQKDVAKRVCSGASVRPSAAGRFCDKLQGCRLWGENAIRVDPLTCFPREWGTRQQNAGLNSRGPARKDLMGPP